MPSSTDKEWDGKMVYYLSVMAAFYINWVEFGVFLGQVQYLHLQWPQWVGS